MRQEIQACSSYPIESMASIKDIDFDEIGWEAYRHCLIMDKQIGNLITK